jgi:predicted peptidase
MINFLFLLAIIGVAIMVILPFMFLTKKPVSYQPEISYELLPPGYRRYTICVPPGYSGEKSVPLILALHYAGHGIPFYGEMILQEMVRPAFEELGAIIVSPDCPVKYWHQPESEQLIFDLLDTIQAKFNIDPDRILVTGYSLGGMGVWHFAGRYPGRFTAAIVMAGAPPKDALEINWRIPLMVIHGREDEVLPLQETKEIVSRLEKDGMDIEFRVLEGVTHYQTNYFVAALRNAIPWLLEVWNRKGAPYSEIGR